MNKGKNRRRSRRGQIRMTMPGREAQQKARLTQPTRINTDPVTSHQGTAGGWTQIMLETGNYTYRALTFGIRCTASLVGITTEVQGEHWVDQEHLVDYISDVRLSANGTPITEITIGELIDVNNFHEQEMGSQMAAILFPGEGLYHNDRIVDAYALGTKGLRDLKLELRQKAAFDSATMEIDCVPHFVKLTKAPGFVTTTERMTKQLGAAGKHTFRDLPDGDDIRSIYIIADGVQHVKLEVDKEVLYDMSKAQYDAYLIMNGRDPDALAGKWFLDIHAEGDARSLAALDRPREVRRGATIKLEITTLNANTEVVFLVTHAGIYAKVR